MNAKNHLIRGAVVSALALTATLASPAFAEYNIGYEYFGIEKTTKPVKRAVANKVVPATPKQRIKRSEIYLNTP